MCYSPRIPILLLVLLALLTLPSCKILECLGDGPTTFNSITLVPSAASVQAGGGGITIDLQGEVQFAGQYNRFNWRIEPSVGTLEPSLGGGRVMYTPPGSISSTTVVKVILDYDGRSGKGTQAEISIEVKKP